MDPKAYWVAFNSIRGIGAVRLRKILEHFGDLSIAWQAPADALRQAGLPEKVVERILLRRSNLNIDAYWTKIQKTGVKVLTWEDEEYPRRLREIHAPPPVFYIRGSLVIEDEWSVAIVGTRRVTSYGKQVTRELASFLARNGITVISGMARGVDSIAHESALEAGGRSLAILGCGVDCIYPSENRQLAERMMECGGLISDYALGTPPDARNFPPRNRLISGLSLATVIIEAGERSGALITASFAVEQGREVFAVPGTIYAPLSVGTNRLIRQGAQPYTSPQELLELLNFEMIDEQRAVRQVFNVEPFEDEILTIIRNEPLHVDEICVRCEEPVEKVSSALVMLELKGIVRQAGDMKYQAIMENREKYG